MPAEYEIRGGELTGSVKVTMAFAGIATRFGPYWFGEFQTTGEFILASLAGEASLSLSAKGESEKISTCNEASCTQLSIKSGVDFAIGSIGNVSGKFEYCSSPDTCEAELFSVIGKARATANVSFTAQGNTYLGESCPSGDVSASLGKITLLVQASVSGSFGIVSFEEEIKKELVIFEGF